MEERGAQTAPEKIGKIEVICKPAKPFWNTVWW
jgi:hypothetical protein